MSDLPVRWQGAAVPWRWPQPCVGGVVGTVPPRQTNWLFSIGYWPRRRNIDLLPKHEDFCFQRGPRSNQIDDETEYQSDEIQRPVQRRPILYAMPTGFNLRQGQVRQLQKCRVLPPQPNMIDRIEMRL